MDDLDLLHKISMKAATPKVDRNLEIVRMKDESGLTFRQIGPKKNISAQRAAYLYHREKTRIAMKAAASKP